MNNTRSLSLASLIAGVASTVVSNIPIINLVNCLLCAAFWGSGILAVWLYRRLAGAVTMRQAVVVGTLAGVWAGVFGFLLSFVGLAGASGLLNTVRPFLSAEDLAGAGQALDPITAMLFNLAGVITNIVFGALGGLIGGAIFKPRPEASDQSKTA